MQIWVRTNEAIELSWRVSDDELEQLHAIM